MRGDKPSPMQQDQVAREAAALADDWRNRVAGVKSAQNSTTALTPIASSIPHGPIAPDPKDPYAELRKRNIRFTTPDNSAKR